MNNCSSTPNNSELSRMKLFMVVTNFHEKKAQQLNLYPLRLLFLLLKHYSKFFFNIQLSMKKNDKSFGN